MVLGIILVVENDVVGHMFVTFLGADNFCDVDTVDVIISHLHRKCPAWT